jgi:hypothetical protein
MFVRIGLKLASAEKRGRENKVFTMGEIQESFLKLLSDIVGTPVSYDKWLNDKNDGNGEPQASCISAKAKAAAGNDKAASSVRPSAAIVTLEDHTDPKWICSQAGFGVGGQVVEKKVEASPEHLYAIFSIDSKVSLHQICSYSGAPQKVAVSIDELLNNWQISKMEPPVAMQDPPAFPESLQEALKRHELYKVILELNAKHIKNEDKLSYYRRPDQVRSKAHIKAESLVLVPVVPASNIFFGNKPGCIPIGECCLVPPAKPATQHGSPDAWEKGSLVHAYWWIGKTSDRKMANVVQDTITFKDLAIPVLTNNCDIEPYTQLMIFSKPKTAARPLANAEVVDDGESEHVDACADDPQAKAKVKAKAKATAKANAKDGSKRKAKAKAKADPQPKKARR